MSVKYESVRAPVNWSNINVEGDGRQCLCGTYDVERCALQEARSAYFHWHITSGDDNDTCLVVMKTNSLIEECGMS